MLSRSNFKKLFIVPFLGIILLAPTTQAFAREGGRRSEPIRVRHFSRYPYYHNYEHYPLGRIYRGRSGGFLSLSVGGVGVYYNSGLFYRSAPEGYVVVPAPAGAVVYTLPDGWHQVVIDGVPYYTYEGVYYRTVPGGYKVVEPPTSVVVEPTTVTVNAPANTAPDSFTINIPNAKGGYTAVTLKRSGTGFTGPQGEFYSEFPKVEQLRAMYTK